MHSKNKRAQDNAEQDHAEAVGELDCIVCGAAAPSCVHEPEQGMWFITLPLCWACHQGPEGWHGTRLRWKLRNMTELKAINETQRQLDLGGNHG